MTLGTMSELTKPGLAIESRVLRADSEWAHSPLSVLASISALWAHNARSRARLLPANTGNGPRNIQRKCPYSFQNAHVYPFERKVLFMDLNRILQIAS